MIRTMNFHRKNWTQFPSVTNRRRHNNRLIINHWWWRLACRSDTPSYNIWSFIKIIKQNNCDVRCHQTKRSRLCHRSTAALNRTRSCLQTFAATATFNLFGAIWWVHHYYIKYNLIIERNINLLDCWFVQYNIAVILVPSCSHTRPLVCLRKR